MPDTREASNVFRIEHFGEVTFVEADEMVISPNEAVLLYLHAEDGSPSILVAKIADQEGLSVTRVASLLTMRKAA